MPKALEHKIEHSLKQAHPSWSSKKDESMAIATLNKLGAMHGSKETKLGEKMEHKVVEKKGHSEVPVDYHGTTEADSARDLVCVSEGESFDYGQESYSPAEQFRGDGSCNRDPRASAEKIALSEMGPGTAFVALEINKDHYGRDWEPWPFKDFVKKGEKIAEKNPTRTEEQIEADTGEEHVSHSGIFPDRLKRQLSNYPVFDQSELDLEDDDKK